MRDTTDLLPASYHYCEDSGKHSVANPADDVEAFLGRELSLMRLEQMMKHLWFAGAPRPPTQLHLQVAEGRTIVVADQMDLHLIWNTNNGKIFLKPIPRYLLNQGFWQSNLKCPDECNQCTETGPDNSMTSCKSSLRKVASGFLYTYACLISSESDFIIANKERLLPRRGDAEIEWADWKKLAQQLLKNHHRDKVHHRFHRAELRLSRLNWIRRFIARSLFQSYIRGWSNYGDFFHDNITWLSTCVVFIALVLSAMSVGLNTDQLEHNPIFNRASYGFAVFAILSPLITSGLMGLVALSNLLKDLPRLVKDARAKTQKGGQNLPA